jgi:hypothetical protein
MVTDPPESGCSNQARRQAPHCSNRGVSSCLLHCKCQFYRYSLLRIRSEQVGSFAFGQARFLEELCNGEDGSDVSVDMADVAFAVFNKCKPRGASTNLRRRCRSPIGLLLTLTTTHTNTKDYGLPVPYHGKYHTMTWYNH